MAPQTHPEAPPKKTAIMAMAWVGALVLLALHLHFWIDPGPELLLNWLPIDLAYRIGWLMLAWIYLMFFCRYVWEKED